MTQIKGVYNATLPTVRDGQNEDVQLNPKGQVFADLGTSLDQYDVVTSRPFKATYVYQAAAAANVVVSETPAILVGMIIGADVGSAVIEVSDHASDGDGAVKIMLTGSTLMTSCKGYVPVGAYFETGIASDMTNQTDVTFIIIPD